jgi:hypothetical protein
VVGIGRAATSGIGLDVDGDFRVSSGSAFMGISTSQIFNNNVGNLAMFVNGGSAWFGIDAGGFTLSVDGSLNHGDHHLEIENGGTYSEIDAGESSFTTSSHRMLKEDIAFLYPRGVPSFANLGVYSYTWKHDGKKSIGLISDEWHATMGREDNGQIDYHEVIITLIAKVAEMERTLRNQPYQYLGPIYRFPPKRRNL